MAFDRAKHRRAEMLAQRARRRRTGALTPGAVDIDESEIDLDFNGAQSLRLVRSIHRCYRPAIGNCTVVRKSTRHSAAENISRGMSHSTVQGVESTEPITLGAVLIAILVFYHHHAVGA